MKKIVYIVLIVCLAFWTNITFATNTQTKNIDKVYNKFILKLEKKYSWKKEISFLKKLNLKLDTLSLKKKYTPKQKVLINDLMLLTNEKIFSLGYNTEKNNYTSNYNNYPLSDLFTLKSLNEDNIFLENWVWYYYKFWKHLFFPLESKVTSSDLKFNKIDTSKDLLFIKEDWNLWYVNDFQKIKLISDDIIFWIPDKYKFLIEIKDDKKELNYDTDTLFKEIKTLSKGLTDWKSKSEKIKAIYTHVLDNVYYPIELDLADRTIYSWIDTYKLKSWACEWYTKLFAYLANFAWIWDIEVIRWFVFDAQDFPNVWHAWIRIWNRYYDPTFDDPVWNEKSLSYSQFNYFNLPSDLFYTNRYLYEELPPELRSKTMDYRKNLISYNLSSLVSKYEKQNFNLLKEFKFRNKHNFKYNENISLTNFSKILPLHNVEDFTFTEKWETKNITKLSYFTLSNDNIDVILNQLNYSISWYKYFKWNNWDWTYDYRLAYNLNLE